MSRPYSILIDPGHGGQDPGAIGDERIKEKDITLNLAKYFRRYVLKGDYLFNPYLTRNRDRTLSLEERCKKAKKRNFDAFISFHCNSFHDPNVEGVEVFYKKNCYHSKILAAEIYRDLIDVMPGHNGRGTKKENFYVLRYNKIPSVLVEFEFLSNPLQAKYLIDSDNQKTMITAVAEAVEFYLEGGGI